jgi:hypothetical protein
MIALRRTPRDKAIVMFRDLAIEREGEFGPGIRLSRATPTGTDSQRADKIIQTTTATAKPIDALVRGLTRVTGVERLTRAIYGRAGYLLDRYTPEAIKAGSDHDSPDHICIPESSMVICK